MLNPMKKNQPEPKAKNPIFKKKAIRHMRETAMVTPEGDRISHRMEWDGDLSKRRGNFTVYPTVAPKKGKEKSTNPADWVEQGAKEARERGELIEVKSRRKAEKLAAGSWKKGQDKKDAMKNYRAEKKASK
jgi:hypothetical protein